MNFSLQLRELLIAYGLSASAMFIGLVLMRADSRAYFRWPVYSAMAMSFGVVMWNLLRKHVLPQAWSVTNADAMYFSALALYFLLGLGAGILLGRLTRTRASRHAPT